MGEDGTSELILGIFYNPGWHNVKWLVWSRSKVKNVISIENISDKTIHIPPIKDCSTRKMEKNVGFKLTET